jgi:ABC-type branched-subunit amino acid transport system ATPase component
MFSFIYRQPDTQCAWRVRCRAGAEYWFISASTDRITAIGSAVRSPAAIGTKWLETRDVSTLSERALVRSGFAFGNGRRRVFPSLTFGEYLDVKLSVLGQQRSRADAMSEATRRFAPAASLPNTICGNFSGGQQQIAMLSVTLLGAPRVVAIEEPELGLAADVIRELRLVTSNMCTSGTTFLFFAQAPPSQSSPSSPRPIIWDVDRATWHENSETQPSEIHDVAVPL